MQIALYHNVEGLGPKRAVAQFARGLLDRGHAVDLFCPDTANERFLPLAALGVRVRQVYTWPCPPRWRELHPYLVDAAARPLRQWLDQRAFAAAHRRVARDIDAGAYDVVWVDACRITETSFLPLYLRTPSVVYAHEPKREWFERPLTRQPLAPGWSRAAATWWLSRERAYLIGLAARSLAAATRVLTNSYHTRDYLARVFGIGAEVCYLGVDRRRFRPGPWPRPRSVLVVGKIAAQDGWDRMDLLLAALERFEPARRPALTIVASACDATAVERLESAARARGLDVSVRRGLSDDELADAYGRAGVVACTAKGEPFGLVAIEAMACGTPVVAVREGGLQESVEHGRTGLLVDATPEAVGHGLAAILDNPGRQRAMGRAAEESAAQSWTVEASVDRFERHVLEVAGLSPGSVAIDEAVPAIRSCA